MSEAIYVSINAADMALPLAVMAGVTALCSLLAVKFFRWE